MNAPCGFHNGPAKEPCQRCGATWEAQYGTATVRPKTPALKRVPQRHGNGARPERRTPDGRPTSRFWGEND